MLAWHIDCHAKVNGVQYKYNKCKLSAPKTSIWLIRTYVYWLDSAHLQVCRRHSSWTNKSGMECEQLQGQ